jgi:hypothetical protein
MQNVCAQLLIVKTRSWDGKKKAPAMNLSLRFAKQSDLNHTTTLQLPRFISLEPAYFSEYFDVTVKIFYKELSALHPTENIEFKGTWCR